MRESDSSLLRRAIDLAVAVTAMIVPARLHWSRRSRNLMEMSAVTLIGSELLPSGGRGLLRRICSIISANREIVVGVALIGTQYQLSEEESSVRGFIAGIGALLVAFGLLLRRARRESR